MKNKQYIYCENDLCIYYKKERCILTRICLDSMGICTASIRMSFDEKTMEKERKRLLEYYEKIQ